MEALTNSKINEKTISNIQYIKARRKRNHTNYCLKHKEEVNKRWKDYYYRNIEKYKLRAKQYYKTHKKIYTYNYTKPPKFKLNDNGFVFNIKNAIRSGVYKIEYVDGSFCIGSTKDFRSRYVNHLRLLRNNKHFNPRLQDKFNKDSVGWSFNLIEAFIPTCKQELLNREYEYIAKCFNNALCLNCSFKRPKLTSSL